MENRESFQRAAPTGPAKGNSAVGGGRGLLRARAIRGLYLLGVVHDVQIRLGAPDNGWSLAAVGVVAAIVQGLLLGRILKLISVRRLAVLGLISSTVAYALWGAATQGWMMYAIIFVNVLGATVASAIQSIISSAADAHSQGKTLGAIGGLNSLMAVIAPLIGAPLLTAVSHLPRGGLAHRYAVLFLRTAAGDRAVPDGGALSKSSTGGAAPGFLIA